MKNIPTVDVSEIRKSVTGIYSYFKDCNFVLLPFFLLEQKSPKKYNYIYNGMVHSEQLTNQPIQISKCNFSGFCIALARKRKNGKGFDLFRLRKVENLEEVKKVLVHYGKLAESGISMGNFFYDNFLEEFKRLEEYIKNENN